MLGFTLKLFMRAPVAFAFICIGVSTNDDTESSIEFRAKEKQAIISSKQSDISAAIDENKVSDATHTVDNSILENSITETKDAVFTKDVDKNDKKNTKNYNKKSHADEPEMLKKFKKIPTSITKFKYKSDQMLEPGFDLTRAEKKMFKIWEGGVIPYYIDVVSFSDKVLRDKIRNYLQMVNSAARLRFVELPGPPSDDRTRWVFFVNRRSLLGCADHSVKNFTTQGVQPVVLGYDCMETKGEMAQAVMSIVGVPAQHNAPDRDKYIQVNMENILPDKKYLFEKLNDDEWMFHDLEYDFNSITHYDLFKYSANGRATIQLKNKFTDLGLAKELSSSDLLKIKMLYNYITRKVELQLPECEKMFKPRSEFERILPHRIHLRPRKKPSRYLKRLKKVLSLSPKHVQNLQRLAKKAINHKIKNTKFQNKNVGKVKKQKNKKNENNLGSKIGQKVYKMNKPGALSMLSDYHSD